ncbi:hypothetical protein Bhyg_16058, partial [Pseudolycoriella hygida]
MSHFIKTLMLTSFIVLTSASAFFNPLLTTTTVPTHISDFRSLPRSDSRANKPDVFPGFDFLEKSTTERPRTPLDFYTKVIGGIVSHGRQAYERIVNNVQKFEINARANLNRHSETLKPNPTLLIAEKLKPLKEQNWSKKYFSAILTATALNKLRNASDPEYLSKAIGTSATHVNHDVMKLHQINNTTDSQNYTNTKPMTFDVKFYNRNKTNPRSGFRYAFIKYVNTGANESTSEQSDSSKDSLGEVNAENNNTMGAVDVGFNIERKDEQNDIDDIEDTDEENGDDDPSNFGIFILEIFGTIAGLTWGALSQIQNLFMQNR